KNCLDISLAKRYSFSKSAQTQRPIASEKRRSVSSPDWSISAASCHASLRVSRLISSCTERSWPMRCFSSAVSSPAYMPLASVARAMSIARRVVLFIFLTDHKAEDLVRVLGAACLETLEYLRAPGFYRCAFGGDLSVRAFGRLGGVAFNELIYLGALGGVYVPHS